MTAASIQINPRSARQTRHESMLGKVLNPAPDFTCVLPGNSDREQVEVYVADNFAAVFAARVHEFMPVLLTMRCLGGVSGVAGIRTGQQDFFLEQYLDGPVEEVLSEALGERVPRASLVEIGNLVATRKGASQIVFLIMASVLHEAGYRWLTFTATRPLRSSLAKLGFEMLSLAPASVDRLAPGQAGEWGDYYAADPMVVAGSLDQAMALIAQRPLYRRIRRLYREQIRALVAAITEGA